VARFVIVVSDREGDQRRNAQSCSCEPRGWETVRAAAQDELEGCGELRLESVELRADYVLCYTDIENTVRKIFDECERHKSAMNDVK